MSLFVLDVAREREPGRDEHFGMALEIDQNYFVGLESSSMRTTFRPTLTFL